MAKSTSLALQGMELATERQSNSSTAWPDIFADMRRRLRTTRQPLGFSASLVTNPTDAFAQPCWPVACLIQ
eukprot:CAMPEP_0194510936 /NCGR_PEP_ID=MMETSP0253-20130528/42434_1 /TAXON_ID=2966 /ORGANISM="Noctiluca scintillans" /LENGTH=70 /DNA_ID=CAMNT_0039354219 /DNA_START=476 /DNA_END=685 /DNA_ORIENTATION=+